MKIYTQKKLTNRNIDVVGTCLLSQLTKGVFLKVTQDAKEVYTFDSKSKKYGYCLQAESDINKQRYIKKDISVIIGFTY